MCVYFFSILDRENDDFYLPLPLTSVKEELEDKSMPLEVKVKVSNGNKNSYKNNYGKIYTCVAEGCELQFAKKKERKAHILAGRVMEV